MVTKTISFRRAKNDSIYDTKGLIFNLLQIIKESSYITSDVVAKGTIFNIIC